MFKMFLLVAIRNLKKNKLTTFINVSGMVLGFGAFVVLSLFVLNEWSYDRWHEKSARTFRFTTIDEALGVTSNQVAITNAMMPEAAENEIPEIEVASRVIYQGEQRLEKGDQGYYSQHTLYVENDFFEIFDLPIHSESQTLEKFNQPHKLIMTKSMASKIFGESDAIGEVLNINSVSWEVVGTMDDVHQNSHLEFDLLMSLYPAQSDSSFAQYLTAWNGLGMVGYAVLSDPGKEEEVERKLAEITAANGVNDFWIPQLQPLEDIHLKSSGILFDYYHQNKGDLVYVYALGGVAIFIILIAAFNFVNLITAQSSARAKEVGIRKVVGSNKTLLIVQHMTETILLSLFALLIAFLLINPFSNIVASGLNFNPFEIIQQTPIALVIFFLMALLIGIIAGVYPSFILSRIKSVNILRGRFQTSAKGVWLRKTLVVLQFIASIGMICITLLVSKQISFIKGKSLGFNKEQVININTSDQGLASKIESFKDRLSADPSILSTSYSNNMPGTTFGRSGVNLEGGSEDDIWIVSVMNMDGDYLTTMEIEMAAGRNYDPSFGADQSESIIINETMAEALDWENPVGRKLSFGNGTQRNVIGVVKDFHFANMRHKIEPLMIFYNPGPSSNLNLKVSPDNLNETIAFMESTWEGTFPNHPIDYQFFDQEFDQIYKSDEQFAGMVTNFTWLSIILSGLGLFGLSFFMVEQRRKEIGVRKVLGSSVSQIVQLLAKEFVWLVIIANLIAWPAAYYYLSQWIGDFQYRIDLLSIDSLLIFFIAGVGALTIAMLAISYKSIRAALMNPVHSIRDE